MASSEGYVALGLGNGNFAPDVGLTVANTNGWYGVPLAELRKDKAGFDDSVLLNQGNGTFIDGKMDSGAGSGNCGAAADFDGDSKQDLAVPTTQGTTLPLGTGFGAWQE